MTSLRHPNVQRVRFRQVRKSGSFEGNINDSSPRTKLVSGRAITQSLTPMCYLRRRRNSNPTPLRLAPISRATAPGSGTAAVIIVGPIVCPLKSAKFSSSESNATSPGEAVVINLNPDRVPAACKSKGVSLDPHWIKVSVPTRDWFTSQPFGANIMLVADTGNARLNPITEVEPVLVNLSHGLIYVD
jgi:hypothetical protein